MQVKGHQMCKCIYRDIECPSSVFVQVYQVKMFCLGGGGAIMWWGVSPQTISVHPQPSLGH